MVEEQKRKETVAAEQKARMQREKQELQAKVSDYQTPEWAKVEDEIDSELNDEEEEEEVNEFYCVVCDKGYKSEKQFTSHENSKRHIDNVEILRQEMLADEENFDFGTATPIDDLDSGIPVENDDEEISAQLDGLDFQEEEEVIEVSSNNKKKKKKNKNKSKMAPNWGFDEETVPEDMDEMSMLAAALEEEKSRRRRKGNNRAGSPIANEPNNVDVETTEAETSATTTPVTVEKESAKTKREKRKEKKKNKEENTSLEVKKNQMFEMYNCQIDMYLIP